MREIIEVKSVWRDQTWEVASIGPEGYGYMYWSKRTHPDQLSAYTATLEEINKEQTNGTSTET